MTFETGKIAAAMLASLCLALFAAPAFAIVEQVAEFPNVRDIQGATLSFDDSDEVIEGQILENNDGSKKVVFFLPDGSEGRKATANVIIDGKPQSFPLVVADGVPVFRTGNEETPAAQSTGGWYFGPGLSVGSYSSDFATKIAQQSAADASALLASQGITDIVPTQTSDDSAFGWGASIEAGYLFADDSRIALDFRCSTVDDFALRAGAMGNLPMSTSVASAESVASADLTTWSVNASYGRFFSPTSNFGFVVSVGSQSVDRSSSFTSTLSVDGVPFDSFDGKDSVDESVLQYGLGLEWTQRQAPVWVPTVGVRYSQTADLDIFDNEQLRQIEAYFTIKRRANKRRVRR